MKLGSSITNELLSEFCDIHPKAIAVDKVDKAKVFPREVNTANFVSLLSTSAEVLGGIDKVFSSTLKGINMDHSFVIAKNNPYQVEPFSLWHLFQDDYWISNTLSAAIFDRSEKILRDTILGEDPLFEAGKRMGAHFETWKLAAIKMMNPEMFLKFVVKKNNELNKVKQVTPLLGRNHGSLRAKYHDHITRTKDGALISKSVCAWYRGCIHYYLSLLELKKITMQETSCTADGDDECVFEIDYRPFPLVKRMRNFFFHSLRPDFAMNQNCWRLTSD
jgi:predicted hydrocarbon binding protein